MSEQNRLKCDVCGSYIDPETGETTPATDGNAKIITEMKEKIKKLEAAADKTEAPKKIEEKGETDDGKEKKHYIIDDIL